ncbi:putative RNA-dependent RNA polymerase [Rhizoctonia solani mitovirus 27]|uniref:RNA-dependent RNA polymerase n=1 Tax=Rhizoctonia solani mitovirus 27 TaxID=2599418 RepID=A0ABX5Y4R2_9VIRU|nr:putative RNA-dependent RNA polymerase [Rhizoctonia solani mitovirus 27]QDW65417.1 putative RNA-dependent RNA polymerase [Rhizoctonia solani mitovirus 27]
MEGIEFLLLVFLLFPTLLLFVLVPIWRLDPQFKCRNLKVQPLAPSMEPIAKKEVKNLITFCSKLFRCSSRETGVLLLIGSRVDLIWTLSGVKFTITYLAECLRIIFDLLSGMPIKDHKTWVSRYSNGVPKLFGMEGRKYFGELILLKQEGKDVPQELLRVCRMLITLCSIFRCMSPEHVIKLSTITDPWTGTGGLNEKLCRGALREMGMYRLRKMVKTPKFLWSNKSGVNARYAFLSAGLDLIAMMDRPSVWFAYIKYCYRMGYSLWLVIFLLFTVSMIPPYIFNQLRELFLEEGAELHLGRLTIIKEMRGKARVVGITDYWTQCLFKPLHDGIYSCLGDLPEDGTNAQLAPIKLMLNPPSGENPQFLSSVDLSAATDRLPVSQQELLLEYLGLPGKEWRDILARPYNYMDKDYVYAVGQPMGAYSSFAMLALTNHVIMHVAFARAQMKYIKGSGQYAILGDDVAMASLSLSTEYELLMTSLGVEINPIKGFRGALLEFAKNIFMSDGTNLSPISAKVLLRSSRDPIFIPSLLNDCINKGYWNILNMELSTLTDLLAHHSKIGVGAYKWLFSILGPQSGFWSHFNNNEVGPRPFQLMFKEFLLSVGVRFEDVCDYYYHKLSRRSHLTLRSLLDLGHSSLAVLKYSQSPWIWSAKKFENAVKLPAPEYMALLTTATLFNLLLPLLLYKWVKGVVRGLYFIAVDSLLNTKDHMDVQLQFAMENPVLVFKCWLQQKFPRSDGSFEAAFHWELGNSPAVAANIYDSSYSRTMSGQFFNWVLSLKLQKPMQLINTRFAKKVTGEDDMMPVVKTAVKCLSKLDNRLAKYYRLRNQIFILNYKINRINKEMKKSRSPKRPT